MSSATERPPFSYFVSRTEIPTGASVKTILSRAREGWVDLVTYLREAYNLSGELHFMYGQRYGWALRFRRSTRLILAMYPNRGCFTVQIILGQHQVKPAFTMGLSAHVLKVLRAAHAYPEGRWLFIPVKSVRIARELRPLIALKISSSRNRRVKRSD